MNRRRFVATSGSAVIGFSSFISEVNKPAVAVEFEITETPTKNPDNLDSLLLDFNKFKMIPRYVDENSEAEIKITLDIEGADPVSSTTNVQFKNGRKISKNDIGGSIPVRIDGINSTETSLDAQVIIQINHPDISDSYTQSFSINAYNPLSARGGDLKYKLVDQGSNVVTEQELGSDESLDDYNGRLYKVHVFNQTGTFRVKEIGDSDRVEALIVGGGGGGGEGGGAAAAGGGGGAGGLIYKEVSVDNKEYSITIGSGGLGGLKGDSPTSDGRGINGQDSVAFGLTALGGGGGGSTSSESNAKDGGNGGGGGGQGGDKGVETQTNSASGGTGKNGGDGNPSTLGGSGDDVGGGGGGAGEVGQNASDRGPAGDGGDGVDYRHIFGDVVGENGRFAGGGGGAVPNYYNTNNGGKGGIGGGGNGGQDGGGEDGAPNTGGGGGGGDGQRAGDGGSGVVIIRYPLEPKN